MIETDEPKAFACKAFTLAFLSQLLQKLHKQLESLGLKSPAYKYTPRVQLRQVKEEDKSNRNDEDEDQKLGDTVIVNGNKSYDVNNETILNDKDTDNEEVKINGDAKSSKKILTKRRRRRRVMSSESSDLSDVDSESSEFETDKSASNDEEASNNEEQSDSTYESDNDSKSSIYDDSDTEDLPVNGNAKNDLHSKTKEYTKIKVDSQNCTSDTNVDETAECNGERKLDVEGIQNFLMGNNFLPSIKLLQDWVLTEKDLILSCGESGESLFQCVVDLLNIFLYYFNSKGHNKLPSEDCKVLNYAKSVVKRLKLEYKTIPLPEDINLRGTNICKFDKDAAEWQLLAKYKPSLYEENIIRMLNFIDFGYQIAKIVPRIRFNRSMKIFYLRKLLTPKVSTKVNHKRNRDWHNSKKPVENREGGLLRRLGRLWLVSQVKELERTGHTPAPSLLALDTAALYKHLKRVKQLLRTRNFIFLVPTIVLQELDELKRERSSARDAIRWLEVQLRSGSRFVRTQRPGQSRPLPLPPSKQARKPPQRVPNYVQILEFCNHFVESERGAQGQGGGGDPESVHGKAAPLLVLLVGTEPGAGQCEEPGLADAARAAGVSVEYIGDFYARWRQTVHKSGKKR
ncbi:unnamed protein product, partial [Iphiclides podalirius]